MAVRAVRQTGVRVAIAQGVTSVKPQMKAGWSIAIETRSPTTPSQGEQAHRSASTVASVEWRGGVLPDQQYDTFGLLMKLPSSAGATLYFPVVQTCASGRREWSAIPAAGQAGHALPNPAPFVRLVGPR